MRTREIPDVRCEVGCIMCVASKWLRCLSLGVLALSFLLITGCSGGTGGSGVDDKNYRFLVMGDGTDFISAAIRPSFLQDFEPVIALPDELVELRVPGEGDVPFTMDVLFPSEGEPFTRSFEFEVRAVTADETEINGVVLVRENSADFERVEDIPANAKDEVNKAATKKTVSEESATETPTDSDQSKKKPKEKPSGDESLDDGVSKSPQDDSDSSDVDTPGPETTPEPTQEPTPESTPEEEESSQNRSLVTLGFGILSSGDVNPIDIRYRNHKTGLSERVRLFDDSKLAYIQLPENEINFVVYDDLGNIVVSSNTINFDGILNDAAPSKNKELTIVLEFGALNRFVGVEAELAEKSSWLSPDREPLPPGNIEVGSKRPDPDSSTVPEFEGEVSQKETVTDAQRG